MQQYTHIFKAMLKGSEKAIQHAYRRSIRALAEFEMSFGAESIPGILEFRWEWIDSYRMLTIMTDGSGITIDFSSIEGIEENLYVLYNSDADVYQSNDIEGKILNRKELFGIPEAGYEQLENMSADDIKAEFDEEDLIFPD